MWNVRRRGARGAVGLSLVSLLWLLVGTGGTQQSEVAKAGQLPYRHYCAVCHGMDGKGYGTMAPLLTVKPADLTQLKAKHEDFFPFWDVYRVIDGRLEVRGHGPRGMPIWGAVLKAEAGADPAADLQAHARILEIVYYLESLQAPAHRGPSAPPRALGSDGATQEKQGAP